MEIKIVFNYMDIEMDVINYNWLKPVVWDTLAKR
jgi:hypothetical protein